MFHVYSDIFTKLHIDDKGKQIEFEKNEKKILVIDFEIQVIQLYR